jgi:sulfatase modifying factor 1
MRYPRRRVLFGVLALLLSTADRALPQPAPARPDSADRGRLEFVLVPAGTFVMGSADSESGRRSDEQRHQATITHAFYLGKYEVTQAQWQAVTGRNPSYLYDCPDCPVESVTWLETVNFCNALSKLMSFPPAYTIRDSVVTWIAGSDGLRLPTEAEWEYACRAGTSTVFNTGDCLNTEQANYLGYDPQKDCSNGMWRGQIVTVGSFLPNPWDLHDMHGNVSEWCWDRYGFLDAAATVDPRGPDTGNMRVIRGGNWHDLGRNCRSAMRNKAGPNQRFTHVGLRLARSMPKDALKP